MRRLKNAVDTVINTANVVRVVPTIHSKKNRVSQKYFKRALRRSGLNKILNKTPHLAKGGILTGPHVADITTERALRNFTGDSNMFRYATHNPLSRRTLHDKVNRSVIATGTKSNRINKHIGYHEYGHAVDMKKRNINLEKKAVINIDDLKNVTKEFRKDVVERAVKRSEQKLKKVNPLLRPFARHKANKRLASVKSKGPLNLEYQANKYGEQMAKVMGGDKEAAEFRKISKPALRSHKTAHRIARRNEQSKLNKLSRKISGKTAIAINPTDAVIVGGAGVAATGGIIAHRRRKKNNV